MLPPGVCRNGCCQSQPCLNGGTCIEHCDSPLEKFTCNCTNKYTGRVCEKYISDCYDVLKYARFDYRFRNKTFIATAVDVETSEEQTIICSLPSNYNRSWTLVESFKLSYNQFFYLKAFFQDSPRSPSSANWIDYRMSLARMQAVRAKSTHFRATCSYEAREHIFPDYLRASFAQNDLMKNQARHGHCFIAEAIDILNTTYNDLSIGIWHAAEMYHPHIDVSLSLPCGTSLEKFPGTLSNEDFFGFNLVLNREFKCTSSISATTNWWFGRNLEG